jgi:hypothetical protein
MMQHKRVVIVWYRIKYGGMIKGQIGTIGYYIKVKVKVTLEQATKAQRERK